MSGKLTPVMQDALDRAKNAGRLIRVRGGFWTTPNFTVREHLPSAHGPDIAVPLWSVGVGTVMGLVKRGHLEITGYDGNHRESEVKPTERTA